MTVVRAQRFNQYHPCPVCGGWNDQERGIGQRCFGYLSSDGDYAHCTREDYAGPLDLEPNSDTYAHRLTGSCRCGQQHGPIDVPKPNGHARNGVAPRIEHVYPYTDEDGNLLYQVVRYTPKDFRQRRPDGQGGWIWTLGSVRLVLYRLSDLLAHPTAPIVIVEGEKDVDRLTALGVTATTAAMGAGKWKDCYLPPLVGREIVVIPDNDAKGKQHADTIIASCRSIARRLSRVELPDAPPKGDVSDWLDAGHSVDELRGLIDQAVNLAKVDRPTDDDGTSDLLNLTELGNRNRFAGQHHENVRFNPALKEWLLWNGQRWEYDRLTRIADYTIATLRSLYQEAAQMEDARERRAMADWARRSESNARLHAMRDSAKEHPLIRIDPALLDADPWLLNVANGTIDLRTGELHAHRRGDLITRLIPVAYDADARLALWDQFLEESTGGSAELIGFLQRAVGYSLTGDTREEKLFFVHGPPRAGKSTFLDALRAILGDYASVADFETFIKKKNDSGPRQDIARLRGVRFVASIETDEGKELAEGLVKMLTGGDTITARFLYGQEFEFKPAFKLWLAANTAPKTTKGEEGIWTRVLRIPFERVVPIDRRDPAVKSALQDPKVGGPAVLAWAVAGCLAWQRDGLGVPPIVADATRRYQVSQDGLADWLANRCVLEIGAWAASNVLHTSYEEYAKRTGEREPLTSRQFGVALKNRGCTSDIHRVGGNTVRGWEGIRLWTDEDEEQENLPF